MRCDHWLESVIAQPLSNGNGACAILLRSDTHPMQQLPARPVLEHECGIAA